MLADLHCHYPMHLLAEEPRDVTLEGMVRVRRRSRWAQRLRAGVLALAARLLNFRRFGDTWRVDLDGLEEGEVGVVFSVLYQPFAEMDLDEWYAAPPEPGYFADLVDQLEDVEAELAQIDPAGARHLIVRQKADLEPAHRNGRVAFVHCVEGGFHLGSSPEAVRANVATLAGRGVRYITLAHLFWRQVATNAPALPFLPDRLYGAIFPQPDGAGLSELGVAAVEAMYEAGILVDVSHMRQDAIDDTFAVLERLDRRAGAPPSAFPVIASHGAFRFGGQSYAFDADVVQRIAGRDGVVGLILAQHQLNDGVRRRHTTDLGESVEVICRHVDAIRDATGSYAHVAIGSDLDGFIKPTMGGLETASDLGRLHPALVDRYGEEAARLILHRNVERVLGRILPG